MHAAPTDLSFHRCSSDLLRFFGNAFWSVSTCGPSVLNPDVDTLAVTPPLVALEAVELAEAEAPRSSVNPVAIGVDAATEVAAADALGIEERHFWGGLGGCWKGVCDRLLCVRRLRYLSSHEKSGRRRFLV